MVLRQDHSPNKMPLDAFQCHVTWLLGVQVGLLSEAVNFWSFSLSSHDRSYNILLCTVPVCFGLMPHGCYLLCEGMGADFRTIKTLFANVCSKRRVSGLWNSPCLYRILLTNRCITSVYVKIKDFNSWRHVLFTDWWPILSCFRTFPPIFRSNLICLFGLMLLPFPLQQSTKHF